MSGDAVQALREAYAKVQAENKKLRVAIGTHKDNQTSEFNEADWFDLLLWAALGQER